MAGIRAVSFWNDAGFRSGLTAGESGQLAGIPLLVKDNIDTRDAPTTAGTPGLRGRVPPQDAPVVAALRRQGAVIVGKSAQHELALGASSTNPVSGTPLNPLDRARVVGGSSGGSAAGVACGIVPAAIGTDTYGSVRLPASFCGLFGFRPTVGRYPTGGVVPLAPSRDTPGPITRSMDDLLLLDSVLSGRTRILRELPLSGITFGINPEHLDGLDADVSAVFDDVRLSVESAGATLRELDMTDLESAGDEAGASLTRQEFVPGLAAYLADRYSDLTVSRVLDAVVSPDVRLFADFMRTVSPDAKVYRDAVAARYETRERMRRIMDAAGAVAVLHPTSPCLPGPVGEPDVENAAGQRIPAYLRYLRFTSLAGALDLPAVTIPVPGVRGPLPVGMELRGIHGRDEDLLRSAMAVSRIVHKGRHEMGAIDI